MKTFYRSNIPTYFYRRREVIEKISLTNPLPSGAIYAGPTSRDLYVTTANQYLDVFLPGFVGTWNHTAPAGYLDRIRGLPAPGAPTYRIRL